VAQHGIGLHHAGLLPKYRVLVEQLAQQGLLKVICGTDTLGVGINVPIRTVLFTRLCKFDGQKTAHPERARLSTRSPAAPGARASTTAATSSPRRPSTSSRTSSSREGRARRQEVVKRKPPEHNFVNWDKKTFKRLIGAQPERLVSRFHVSHGMLLNVLSRAATAAARCSS
jgi:superfamily II RNA helicase